MQIEHLSIASMSAVKIMDNLIWSVKYIHFSAVRWQVPASEPFHWAISVPSMYHFTIPSLCHFADFLGTHKQMQIKFDEKLFLFFLQTFDRGAVGEKRSQCGLTEICFFKIQKKILNSLIKWFKLFLSLRLKTLEIYFLLFIFLPEYFLSFCFNLETLRFEVWRGTDGREETVQW